MCILQSCIITFLTKSTDGNLRLSQCLSCGFSSCSYISLYARRDAQGSAPHWKRSLFPAHRAAPTPSLQQQDTQSLPWHQQPRSSSSPPLRAKQLVERLQQGPPQSPLSPLPPSQAAAPEAPLLCFPAALRQARGFWQRTDQPIKCFPAYQGALCESHHSQRGSLHVTPSYIPKQLFSPKPAISKDCSASTDGCSTVNKTAAEIPKPLVHRECHYQNRQEAAWLFFLSIMFLCCLCLSHSLSSGGVSPPSIYVSSSCKGTGLLPARVLGTKPPATAPGFS